MALCLTLCKVFELHWYLPLQFYFGFLRLLLFLCRFLGLGLRNLNGFLAHGEKKENYYKISLFKQWSDSSQQKTI